MKLVAQVEIQQLEELEVFDALRLSVEVLAEVLAAEVLAAEVLAEVLTEILAELTAEIAAEIASRTELKVLLMAVYYWNSLKSYTSFSA